jgi:N-acetyllactosaminide beta-1,3-N-acetylglucosaminyltransferase
MLKRNQSLVQNRTDPYVFVVPVFEIPKDKRIPDTKRELVELVKKNLAVYFHQYTCTACQLLPEYISWLKAGINSTDMNVVDIVKRHFKRHSQWEPIYIGTKEDPLYDEILPWEGYRDKMTQVKLFFRVINPSSNLSRIS